jgi:PhnB protein
MKTTGVPEGCHAVTPYLTVADAARLIDFLKRAFGATERARVPRPDGSVMHAQVYVGDSLLMIGEPQDPWKPRPSMLYHYVADVDAVYQQALAAGGISVVPPTNMFYGDRSACVKDTGDNDWWIATRLEDASLEEIKKRTVDFFKNKAKHAD